MNSPIKPSFPPPTEPVGDPDSYYKYLASVGVSAEDLSNICVKEVEITGISDTTLRNVDVFHDGADYTGVPVLIHTDIGTRAAFIKGEEEATAEDYFEDAALIWPVPGGQMYTMFYAPTIYNTEIPRGLALISGGKPVAIIGAVSSVDKVRDTDDLTCFPTWQPYISLVLETMRWEVPEDHTPGASPPDPIVTKRAIIIDMRTGEIAKIPNSAGTELMLADLPVPGTQTYPIEWLSFYNGTGISILENLIAPGGANPSVLSIAGGVGPADTSQKDFLGAGHYPAWSGVDETTPLKPGNYSMSWYSATSALLDSSLGSGSLVSYLDEGDVHNILLVNMSHWGEITPRNNVSFHNFRTTDGANRASHNLGVYRPFTYDEVNYSVCRATLGVSFSEDLWAQHSYDSSVSFDFGFYLINEDANSILSLMEHSYSDTCSGTYPYNQNNSRESLSIAFDDEGFAVGLKKNFVSEGFLYFTSSSSAECGASTVNGSLSGGLTSSSYDFKSYYKKTAGVFDYAAVVNQVLEENYSLFGPGVEQDNYPYIVADSVLAMNGYMYLQASMRVKALDVILRPFDVEHCDLPYNG